MRGSKAERGGTTPPPTDVAAPLLEHLRTELSATGLTFGEPPASLGGGYDTRIFAFRLHGAPSAWSGSLILRVLAPAQDPLRALKERAIQNALAALGYPVPRVLAARADRRPFGAGFLVMERAPGRPLLDAQRVGAGGVLARAHARLHALEPEPLLRALDEEGRAAGGSFDRSTVTYEGYLAMLDRRIRRSALEGLEPGLRWLVERQPREPRRRVICHGDFHPQNLLVAQGELTAVLDWPNTVVAEPEFDVASTRSILALVPITLAAVPVALRPLVALVRPIMVARYLSAYRRARPLDRSRMPYYEAAACMRGLVRAAEVRVAGGGAAASPLDASPYADRLAARFTRISGVRVTLPPLG